MLIVLADARFDPAQTSEIIAIARPMISFGVTSTPLSTVAAARLAALALLWPLVRTSKIVEHRVVQ